MDHNGRALLADEMGLGKSFQSLLFREKQGIEGPTVIICPAFLKLNWEEECLKHFNMHATIAEGRKPPKRGLVKPKILIINYEILGGWLKYLHWLKPELVIADEAHRIKNTKTQAYRNVRLVVNGLNVPYFLPLTGTPTINTPAELWPILNLLWPGRYPNQHKFCRRYCNAEFRPWGYVYSGGRNLKKLHRRLKKHGMVRRLKSEVMGQLPPINRVVIALPIKNRKEYEAAVNNFASWLREKNPKNQRKVNKTLKAEALVKVGYLLRLAAELKMDAVKKWVHNYLETDEHKLVLFGTHRARIKELRTEFKKRSVVVDGSTTGEARQDQVELFKTKKSKDLFIGNMKAASVGYSLPAATVAFFEMSFTAVDHLQGEGRCHGIGRGVKGRQTTAFYLVARDTVEEKLCKLVQNKFRTAREILDDNKGEDFNLFDLLLEEMAKWKGKRKRK